MPHASYISTDYRADIPFRGNGKVYQPTPDGWRPMSELARSGVHSGQHFNMLLSNGAIVKGWPIVFDGRTNYWTFNVRPGAGHARIAPVGYQPIPIVSHESIEARLARLEAAVFVQSEPRT